MTTLLFASSAVTIKGKPLPAVTVVAPGVDTTKWVTVTRSDMIKFENGSR